MCVAGGVCSTVKFRKVHSSDLTNQMSKLKTKNLIVKVTGNQLGPGQDHSERSPGNTCGITVDFYL